MSVVVPVPAEAPAPSPTAKGLSVHRLARFLAAVSALCAAAAFPGSAFFDIRIVSVTGNAAIPADEVLRRAGVGPGTNVFHVDHAAIRARLLADPRIDGASVSMAFPHRLALVIREREPIAALVAGDGYLLLTSGGVVITAGPDRGVLPVLAVDRFDAARGGGMPGAVVGSDDARLGARIAGALPAAIRDRVAAVRVDGMSEVALILRDGTSVRLGGSKGIDGRLEMVPHVLAAITARGLVVASVDVRFPANVIVQPAHAPGDAPQSPRQENLPVRGIVPAMHRPSIP